MATFISTETKEQYTNNNKINLWIYPSLNSTVDINKDEKTISIFLTDSSQFCNLFTNSDHI